MLATHPLMKALVFRMARASSTGMRPNAHSEPGWDRRSASTPKLKPGRHVEDAEGGAECSRKRH
eukprot:2018793-Pyramimonas_sp.AAC.1